MRAYSKLPIVVPDAWIEAHRALNGLSSFIVTVSCHVDETI